MLELRACSRTVGYSTPVHERSTKWNNIEEHIPTSLKEAELLSNLVFECCQSCGDLVWFCGFNSVFERDACDDFGEVIKAA